jgi:hypothetical protein
MWPPFVPFNVCVCGLFLFHLLFPNVVIFFHLMFAYEASFCSIKFLQTWSPFVPSIVPSNICRCDLLLFNLLFHLIFADVVSFCSNYCSIYYLHIWSFFVLSRLRGSVCPCYCLQMCEPLSAETISVLWALICLIPGPGDIAFSASHTFTKPDLFLTLIFDLLQLFPRCFSCTVFLL